MPTITQLAFDPKIVSLSVERAAKRSPGVHLSGIIRDMLITAGVEQKVKGKAFSAEEQHMLFEQGFLWERLVAEYTSSDEYRFGEWDQFVSLGLQSLIDDEVEKSSGSMIRPGEQQLDGVYITPDAINVKLWFYEEWKATAIRSSRFDIQQRKPQWLWQGAANCKVFGMTRAMYRIWHYAEMPPKITQLMVSWTEDEIEFEWKKILTHLQYMREQGRA